MSGQPEHIRSILARMDYRGDARRRAWEQFGQEWNCSHEQWELRAKTNSAGRLQYGRQCLRCGGHANGAAHWIARARIPDPTRVPPWDEDLRERYLKEMRAARDEVRTTFELAEEERSREWWDAYNQYLTTAHWQVKRRKVLERARYICEGCGERRATQVHHVSYEHVGDELLWELRAVCDDCHAKVHPHRFPSSGAA